MQYYIYIRVRIQAINRRYLFVLVTPSCFSFAHFRSMSSPYSSSSAFSSPGGSTVRVYSDRVISTMQAPTHSSPSRSRGVEGPSGSPSETVYFLSSQTGHAPLAARLSVLEEEVSALRADLILVKGKLKAQEAKKRLLDAWSIRFEG